MYNYFKNMAEENKSKEFRVEDMDKTRNYFLAGTKDLYNSKLYCKTFLFKLLQLLDVF